MWILEVVLVVACSTLALAVDPIVDLGYSNYRGRLVGDGTTQWLGIRYAKPPLGALRFAAPVDPLPTKDVQDAAKFGPICLPGNPTDWTTKPYSWFTISEDCLFVNVFAPSNATSDSKLPVMFFIQGGGFGSNSNANYNGSDLARVGNMIIVSLNYRVGPYGFLQSKEVEGEGGLNAGIKDIIKALNWTKDNVSKFGGDPEHVVLNGDSAGAMAIVFLLTSPKMRNANLFIGAISESTSQAKLRTLDQSKTQYDCLLNATGCSSYNSTSSSLACLRSLNATKLQTTNCSFQPHLDNDIIPLKTLDAFDRGEYLKVPTIFGNCNQEGAKDAGTQNIDTLSDFYQFTLSQAPSLSNSSLSILAQFYILNKTEPVFPNAGRLWRQASNALTEYRSTCVNKLYQDSLVRDRVPTWNYRYGVLDPEQEAKGWGAYHTVELFAVWGPNNTDGNPPHSYNTTNAAIVPVVQHYWISFIKHLDPNKARLAGSPEWESWVGGRAGDADMGRGRLHFITNGTGMERMGREQEKRCKVLEPLVRLLEQEIPQGTVTELKLPDTGKPPPYDWGSDTIDLSSQR